MAVARPQAFLDEVLSAGVRLVQYRAKRGVDRRVLHALVVRCRASGATLIVNDDVEAAVDIGADGVHLGQEDLAGCDVADVRRALGGRLLGMSCGTPDEARGAEAAGADYVGCGPFAATGSKADAGAPIGAAGVRAVVRATSLPVAAIGGIDLAALDDVARSGARMAAVISALARASDVRTAAGALVARWHEVAH